MQDKSITRLYFFYSQFNLYPNPTDGKLHIQSAGNEPYLLQIRSLSGQLHMDIELHGKTELDLGKLTDGCYEVSIRRGSELYRQKLIKM